MRWRDYSQNIPNFDSGWIVNSGTTTELSDEIKAAYNAPFPDDIYKEGARQFPTLVPITPDDPASGPNREAWKVLQKWDKPFLCAFGDSDPITRGADRFFKAAVPGAKDQPHTTIEGGGHFIQEDRGDELARVIVDWMSAG
jgi:haloalkane dehalogenase